MTLRLLAWASYDLANTFFAVAMLSFYFPLWVVEDLGAKELVFSLALASSMIAVALLMPFCGTVSDVRGRRMRYLRWTTLGCILATMLVGLTDRLMPALILFALGNLCCQLGTVFYDALLWEVAKPGALGRASGIGAAFGYLGSMLGLTLLWPFVRQGGHQAAFIPSALLFLLFAIPSFIVIKDPPSVPSAASLATLFRQTNTRLLDTLRHARSYPALCRFFIASFFSLNAINTILVFMGVYTKTVLGFTEEQIVRFFLVGQGCAVAGSLVSSVVISRLGARRTLMLIWGGWLAAIGLARIVEDPRWLWVIGPVMGFCLGSTWATSRVLLTQLSPKDRLGEFFGLAGLLGRASSVVGPLIWGLIVIDQTRYHRAFDALLLMMATGLWLLRRVPEPDGQGAVA